MYCAKCGKELINSEQYCPVCGTKVETSEKFTNINYNKVYSLKDNIIYSISNLGKSTPFYFSIIGLLIIGLIMILTPVLRINANYILDISQSYSIFEVLGLTLIKISTIMYYITTIVIMLLPLLLKKRYNNKLFIISMIAPIWTVFWFIIALIATLIRANEYKYTGISVSLTITGVIFIISTLGTIALSIILISNLVKVNTLSTSTNTSE